MKLFKFIILSVLLYSSAVFAAEAAGLDLTEFVSGFLVKYASKHPWLMISFLVMAKARALMKPLFSLLHQTDMREGSKYDKFLDKIEGSKILKALVWFADLLVSAKVVDPKKQALKDFKRLK